MLCNQFIPKSLNDIITHGEIVTNLKKLAKTIKEFNNLPNMLLYGNKSSGKYTMIKCLLNDIYGPEIYNTTTIQHVVKQNCSSYKINIIKSKFHFETSFTGLQFADKIVLTSLLDNFFNTLDINTNRYKILIIKHFDELSIPAQMSLKRRIETGSVNVRYIFIVNSINKIDNAILSRCFCLRCRLPYTSEIVNCLKQKYINLKGRAIKDAEYEKAAILSKYNISCAFYYLNVILECGINNTCCPIDTLINTFIDLLFLDSLELIKLRDIITQLQLSKIDIQLILMNTIKRVSEQNETEIIHKIADIAADQNMKYNITSKYSICLELFFVKTFNLFRLN